MVNLPAASGAVQSVIPATLRLASAEKITMVGQFFLTDFDWDGNLDIVFAAGHPDTLVPSLYSPTISVLFGNADGTFNGAMAYLVGGGSGDQAGGLALADFN